MGINKEKNMKNRQAWLKFKDSGLLWLINGLLQHMGYVIAFKFDDHDNLIDVYPMEANFKGFTDELEQKGRCSLGKHLEQLSSTKRRS